MAWVRTLEEQKAQAAYDLGTLPSRRSSLRGMLREPHHTVEAMRIMESEIEKITERIGKAKLLLAQGE